MLYNYGCLPIVRFLLVLPDPTYDVTSLLIASKPLGQEIRLDLIHMLDIPTGKQGILCKRHYPRRQKTTEMVLFPALNNLRAEYAPANGQALFHILFYQPLNPVLQDNYLMAQELHSAAKVYDKLILETDLSRGDYPGVIHFSFLSF